MLENLILTWEIQCTNNGADNTKYSKHYIFPFYVVTTSLILFVVATWKLTGEVYIDNYTHIMYTKIYNRIK